MDRASLINDLVSSAASVACDDLQGLAQIHTLLQLVNGTCSGAEEVAPAPSAVQRETAVRACELVGRLILGEVDSAEGAISAVRSLVEEIRSEVGGLTPIISGGAGPAEKPATAVSAVAAAVEIPEEAPVNPDDLPLVAEFVGESISHLDLAESELLRLEQDPGNADAINAVFRSFHTIKGVSGFLNLRQIGALSHVAEGLLDLGRQGKLKIAGPVASVVLEAADTLRSLIGNLEAASKNGEAVARHPGIENLIGRLRAVAAGVGAESQKAPAVASANQPPAVVKEAAPAATQAVAVESPAAPPVDRRQGDRRKGDRRQHEGGSDATVKVSTDRLDTLINMVGELVVAESMVRQNVSALTNGNQRLARNLGHLGKITRELQHLSMAMRMVPIQGVFQKMTRLVRDLGQKANKQVDLVISGGETELDRNVVEAIGDPLVHMVRNSADHGIESPEDRERAGKPRTGQIHLNAQHKAGNIIIEISDDGRGLNKKKILKKAIENGIVREGQELSEQEIFRLIFAAGLSTADKVTDVSGRGVGMDVVKRNIEALRGGIDIESTEGAGTKFTIRLPLTLAVIDGLIVRVGEERYILPITSIEQSLRPKAEQISTVQNRGEVCHVRGDLLPLFRLHRLFDVTPRHEDPTQALVVIVRDNERQCCLLVDELLGQQQVVIKSLNDSVGLVSGVSGGAILGDGNVCLILDVPGLISLSINQGEVVKRAA